MLGRLAAKAASSDAPVEAELFLDETIAPQDIDTVVQRAVAAAAEAAGLPQSSFAVGKARGLSRSVSVTAPLALLRTVMAGKEFTSLLPSDLSSDEATIRPVKQ